MAKDGSEALGTPEVVGTFVAARGNTTKLIVGGIPLAKAAEGGGTGGMPDFGQAAYLAVGADQIALVNTATGLFSIKPKVGSEALARFSRTEISSVELDRGALKNKLTLAFANGDLWEFEIPKAYNKGAKKVVEELGGSLT